MNDASITLLLVARIPPAGLASFEAYEAGVLPLLEEHDGRLARRLRTTDHSTEVHLVTFPSRDHFERYRSDPRRSVHQHLLVQSGATTELLELIEM